MEQQPKPDTLKIKVDQYEYKKVLKQEVEIHIPQEPIYYQEWNHRVLIGILPEFKTFDDKSIYSLTVISICKEDCIMNIEISTNPNTLSDMITKLDMKGKSYTDMLADRVIRYLLYTHTQSRISSEVFVKAFYEKHAELCKTIAIQ